MSNNNSNNCAGSGTGAANTSGGTVTITGAGGGGGGGGISVNSNGHIVYTIPTWIGPLTWNPTPEDPPPETKKSAKSDGCSCKKCKEFYPYAEPNQEDGTLICYGCRTRW